MSSGEPSIEGLALARQRLKHGAKWGARRVWPLIERLSEFGPRDGFEVTWSDRWSPDLSAALAEVRGLDDDDRRILEILAEPTTATKRHALVQRDGRTVAVVSVRRRPGFWEPVASQCVPGTPIGSEPEQLGHVLRALRIHLHVVSLFDDPAELRPQVTWSYPHYVARLDEDYEAHWPKRGGMNYREARKKTTDLDVRIDHPGDVDWLVDHWVDMWAGHPSGEVASGPDRKRLWNAQVERGAVHSVMLTDDGQPVAGCVHYCSDGVVKFECTARDHRYDKRRVGTRALDVSFQWAKEAGYEIFDMGGGGGYKHWWAPPDATFYGGVFRPSLPRGLRSLSDRVMYAAN